MTAAMAALAAVWLALPQASNAEWQRGMDYTAYSTDAYAAPASDASLARLAQDGNSHVSIVVMRYMATPSSTVIAPTAQTASDASILHAMQTARSLGLSVTLKPQVDVSSGWWSGAISPADPAAWFASYEDTIDHYADLAREGGASMFVVGTELGTMSGSAYTARWQQLIADVRARFSGSLTYAANYDEFQRVGFWPSLDYIGVDAYWGLADVSDQPVSALVSAWTSRGFIPSLRAVSVRVGKPVLFTEIGYRSVAGATVHPNWWNTVVPYDAQEQANAYEAFYEAFAGQPWFAGVYWWRWPAALPPNAWNGDYAPTFKPAEAVLQSWNARLAPPAAAAPVAQAPVAPVAAPPAKPRQPVKPRQPAKRSRRARKRTRSHRAKTRHAVRRRTTRKRRTPRSAASRPARRGRSGRGR